VRSLLYVVLVLISSSVFAEWHKGKIQIIAIGYDGKTISIVQEGYTKDNCTCYKAWPNHYCLDRTRESFKDEFAFLLAAKAKGKSVSLNIDEATCYIQAMYE
jgi:hypothetical protein